MNAGACREGPWLDLVSDLLSGPVTRWPTETVAELLLETFDGVGAAFYQPHADGTLTQLAWPRGPFARHYADIVRWGEQRAPREHPLLRYYLTTGDRRAMQVADVPVRFADRRVVGRWREWCAAVHDGDVAEQLALPIGSGPAPSTSFLVGRADPLTAREKALATRLQGLLVGIDRQIGAFARWSVRGGATGVAAADDAHLTPRELAVLDLLASGRTARVIARDLAVAERTVQKHLERIYRKLGVEDRLGAVQRAQGLGLVPPATYFPTLPPRRAAPCDGRDPQRRRVPPPRDLRRTP